MSGLIEPSRKTKKPEFSEVADLLLNYECDSMSSVRQTSSTTASSYSQPSRMQDIKYSSSKKPGYLNKLPKIAKDHPVYSRLAELNGWVNSLSKGELAEKLKQFQVESEGKKEVMVKRLKNFYRHQLLIMAGLRERSHARTTQLTTYDYFIVIDFEATCEAGKQPDFQHEIIEFPAVLVNGLTGEIEDEFQEFCLPTLNSELSDFCLELTGITQEQVDSSSHFPDVLQRFTRWLEDHDLGTKHSFALVTDGPWDMGRFLLLQCSISGLRFPEFAQSWCNIRKIFSNFYDTRRYPLSTMLELLGLTFEGRAHSGMDDARNISRILSRLLLDGAYVRVNERIYLGPLPSQSLEPVPANLKVCDMSSFVVPISNEEFKRNYKCKLKLELEQLVTEVNGIHI